MSESMGMACFCFGLRVKQKTGVDINCDPEEGTSLLSALFFSIIK
jgi:hypothetical protein